MILDEPFKCVQKDKLDLVADLLNQISEKMGIQIIIVTHIPELIVRADRIIWIERIKEVSREKFSGDFNSFLDFLHKEISITNTYEKYLYKYFIEYKER